MVTVGNVDTEDGEQPGVLYLVQDGELWLVQDTATKEAIERDGGTVHLVSLAALHAMPYAGEIPRVEADPPDGLYRIWGLEGRAHASMLLLHQRGTWARVEEDLDSAVRRFGAIIELLANASGTYAIGTGQP
jgi:hypothetical protein